MGSYFVIGPWDGKGEDGNAALTRLYGAAPAMVAERKARIASHPATVTRFPCGTGRTAEHGSPRESSSRHPLLDPRS
jgi:hypothetical protein